LDVDVLGHLVRAQDVTGLWLTAGLFGVVAGQDPG
jgi:hypothetical protein